MCRLTIVFFVHVDAVITRDKKIIIACDSFKGSLTSLQAGIAAMKGVKMAVPDAEVQVVTIADGGEGTVNAILSGAGGERIYCDVMGPLGQRISAYYGCKGDTAIIEMAQASGITLLPEAKRNPWLTTSYGTGELIADALCRGYRKFMIALGGSATNDGGAGMLRALGFRFIDNEGNIIGDGGGGELRRIAGVDDSNVKEGLREAEFIVACDVTNPLLGPNGASYVFAPQKGADSEMVVALDKAMQNYLRVIADFCGKDLSTYPGTGAAGGMGFAFLSLLKARLKPGINMVLNAIDFKQKLIGADLVITGEGRLDAQTCMGKAPYGVLKLASEENIPVIAIGGCIMPGADKDLISAGFRAVYAITDGTINLHEAMKPEVASKNIMSTVAQILNKIK